ETFMGVAEVAVANKDVSGHGALDQKSAGKFNWHARPSNGVVQGCQLATYHLYTPGLNRRRGLRSAPAGGLMPRSSAWPGRRSKRCRRVGDAGRGQCLGPAQASHGLAGTTTP